MKFIFAVVASIAFCAAGSEVTPVQKVVQLLEGMLTKAKDEKHAEQVQFAAYKQFCDDTSVSKNRAIQEASQTIGSLNADIEMYVAQAAKLGREITGHDADIAAWTGDKKATGKVRSIEKTDYDATHQDYSESIDALQRAIKVLKDQGYDRAQAPEQPSALAQVASLKDLSLIPPEARKALDLFLVQADEDPLDVVAPDAHGYEFESHGIIGMLEKLLDKFIEERTNLEKEETNSRHAHDVLIQDLSAQINQGDTDRTQKSLFKAKQLQSKADASGDLADTTANRDSDQHFLNDLTATCGQKASDFESRQTLRTDEIQAIAKAIEILSSDGVAGHAATYLPSLAQRHASFAQFMSAAANPAQQRAAQFLQDQGRQLRSRVLAAVAAKVAEDPFEKVKKMIKDLITRLMEEANSEASHKGWCDTELATNEQTRREKTQAVETLHSEIDELQSSVVKLTQDIGTLTSEVADLDSGMAKRTTLRQEEKATNAATVKDSQEAQTALAQALTILREFYARAGEATSFAQEHPAAPAIFDSPYKGLQAENGGVIGMLEVIESDFARLEADTTSSEAAAQKAYDEFMTDAKVNKAQKETDINHKTSKKQDEAQALTLKKADLDGTQNELDAALAYYDKLKPSCVDASVSYDSRVARRKEEIESLQEALRILNGEDLS